MKVGKCVRGVPLFAGTRHDCHFMQFPRHQVGFLFSV